MTVSKKDAGNHRMTFSSPSTHFLDLVSTRFEVDRRLIRNFSSLQDLRKRAPTAAREASVSEYLDFADQLVACIEHVFDWKFANTLLKLADSGKLRSKTTQYQKLANSLIQSRDLESVARTDEPLFDYQSKGLSAEVPFTLLVADHPVSYAYLWALQKYSLAPEEIIFFVSGRHQKRRFARLSLLTYERWIRNLGSSFSRDVRLSLGAKFTLRDFLGSKSLRPIHTGSVNDPTMQHKLANASSSNILFSSGGREEIISPETFSITRKNFLHFHPGVLPEIRGADGLLWSALLRQQAGVSGFWMRRGIDSGPVVAVSEFAFPDFGRRLRSVPTDVFYHNLLNTYDPLLRAKAMLDLFSNQWSLNQALEKSGDSGGTGSSRQYHPMHRTLRNKVISVIRG